MKYNVRHHAKRTTAGPPAQAPEDCFYGSGLFSRELGYTSTADELALRFEQSGHHAGVYSFLEGKELVVREGPEEALEQDHGLAEGGIQVVVVVVQGQPQGSTVQRGTACQMLSETSCALQPGCLWK